MISNGSIGLLATAAAPVVFLMALGFALFAWQKNITVLSAILFSLGSALLALLLLVVISYSFAGAYPLGESLLWLVGFPLLCYVVTLAVLVRSARISLLQALIGGLIGLVPLYYIGGFVLIFAACSFGTGGC